MKSLSLLAKVAVLSVMMVGIGACGKKSKSNSVAAVGAGYMTCTTGMNPYTNQPCQIGTTIYGGQTGQMTCTTGINPYTNQPCQIGTMIYGGQTGIGQYPGQYPGQYGQQYGQQTGCEQANAMYPGHYYVPVQVGYGQMMCQLVY